ncbi:MAG: ATP-binding protein [Acidimicrobiales bacterium]
MAEWGDCWSPRRPCESDADHPTRVPRPPTAAGGLAPGVHLDVELRPGALVAIDPAELARLVLNILVNAQEALPGEGRITVTAGPADGLSRAWAQVTVTVTDNGTGIAPEVLPRAFERSFSTKSDQGSRGFGLGAHPSGSSGYGAALPCTANRGGAPPWSSCCRVGDPQPAETGKSRVAAGSAG